MKFTSAALLPSRVVLSADEVPEGAGRFSMVTLTNENLIKGNLEE